LSYILALTVCVQCGHSDVICPSDCTVQPNWTAAVREHLTVWTELVRTSPGTSSKQVSH